MKNSRLFKYFDGSIILVGLLLFISFEFLFSKPSLVETAILSILAAACLVYSVIRYTRTKNRINAIRDEKNLSFLQNDPALPLRLELMRIKIQKKAEDRGIDSEGFTEIVKYLFPEKELEALTQIELVRLSDFINTVKILKL